MRHKIWTKDDFFEIGGQRIDMDPAVVELPESTMLSWNYNFGDPAGPYGEVTDIRLEDGEITGELRVFDPTWDDGTMADLNVRLGGYFTNVDKIEIGGRYRVIRCKLREVSIFPLPLQPMMLP